MEWLRELTDALGMGQEAMSLSPSEAALRTIVVYVVVVALVRIGKKRSMGRMTAFDLILAIMLGSITSRAITGNAPMVPALTAAAVLLAMHWLAAFLAFRWSPFGTLIKGRNRELVRDGELAEDAMQRSQITRQDLQEAMRRSGVRDLDEVESAHLERDGEISIVSRRPEPRVVEVKVEEGVQTVRVEIS